jgi:hypothetical protein
MCFILLRFVDLNQNAINESNTLWQLTQLCTQGNFILKCGPLNLIYKCINTQSKFHLVPHEGIIRKDIAMFHLENEGKEIMLKHQL